MVAYPTSITKNVLIESVKQANRLRLEGQLGLPMCFGLTEIVGVMYIISEPCQDVTLSQVLERPSIYQPYLKAIVGYLFQLFKRHPQYRVSTKNITLRPIHFKYSGFEGYGHHQSPYIPTVWYWTTQLLPDNKFRQELGDFASYYTEHLDVTLPVKNVFRLESSNLKKSKLFVQAGIHPTTYDIYNQLINNYPIQVAVRLKLANQVLTDHAKIIQLINKLAEQDDTYSQAGLRRFLLDGDEAALKFVKNVRQGHPIS
jgi:hypothetical protein